MRHRPQRLGASWALTLALVACAGSSAAVPATAVGGIQTVRLAGSAADASTAPPAGPDTAGAPVDRPAASAAPTTPTASSATALGGDAVFVPPPVAVAREAGDRARTETIGGIERQWTVVVPPGTSEDAHLPMLIVLHGVGGKGTAMRKLGFERFAAAAGVLMVYPDATGGSWNDGRPGMEPLAGTPADDVAFLRTVIDRTSTEFGGDPARVSIAGFSNGALMASRAACDMADRLESVVLVSGSGPRDMAQRCTPSRPLPVMVVFGTGDATVPYNGGQVAAYAGKARGQVASVHEVLDVWRSANGCTTADTQEVVAQKPVITAMRSRGCRADIVHYCINGGAHEWLSDAAFDTTTEAWRFVAGHYV